MQIIGSDRYNLVIGLGKTGYACARFLFRQGIRVQVADSRDHPHYLAQLQTQCAEVRLHLGVFSESLCVHAHRIILSPGVAITEPALQAALIAGVPIISDIDLFSAAAQAPIVAITGSNAKSTVTSLLGDMAQRAGWHVAVGGNLHTPAVDLLADDVRLYIIEMSSFQLENTHNLGAKVACVLNISPDHMDRYTSFAAYHQAKHRIFQACEMVVENAQDQLTQPLSPDSIPRRQFTLQQPDLWQYGIRINNGQEWLAQGMELLMPVSALAMSGRHNVANSLAAIALADCVNLPRSSMWASLRRFKGLPHRCEWVAEHDGATYINDSKGTNVGATAAAIGGLGTTLSGKIILLAGGVSKNANFTYLVPIVARFCRSVVVYGDDGQQIETALRGYTQVLTATDMPQALQIARQIAQVGDLVLLSPACASFDAYPNFEKRGEHFRQLVEQIT